MSRDLAEEIAYRFKVLSNPIRLRILALCLAGERTSRELRESLGISKPLLIAHLRKLVNAGFLTYRVEVDEERGIVRKYYRTVNGFRVCIDEEDLRAISSSIVVK
ncbi:MAG TPA: ArsR family transcriptional regulator [Thermoproteales archaeon]|nr:ArsR family transcriptional regulator [Thermoproteales archaeon]